MRGNTEIINPTIDGTTYEIDLGAMGVPKCTVSISCDKPFTIGNGLGTFRIEPPLEDAAAVIMDQVWDPARYPILTIETDEAPTRLDVMVAVVS